MRRQVLFVGLICVVFLVNTQEEKTIGLDGVTIQASSIIRKKDRQLIFPSKDQVRRSMDGLDLTRWMSLPRLWVDPNTKSISMANGNVRLRIDGVLASSLEVVALSPEDIKRTEYHDNPGLRYGEGIDVVLGCITIKRTSGGSLSMDLSHQLNTLWMADYIYDRYNRGRSEFSLSSFANGHRYKKARQDRTEIFHTPDGVFRRTQEGTPGRDYKMYWTTMANYSYARDDGYFLNAELNFYYYNYPHNCSDALLRSSGSMVTTHLIDSNKSLNTRPSLDLYYFRKSPRKQSLAVNVMGAYSNTDSRRTHQEELESIPLIDIYTKVDGKRYSVVGEGIYEKELGIGRISTGLKHAQACMGNVYPGPGDYTTHMTKSESYMYTQYVGAWKKLVYNVGLGASRSYLSRENVGSYNRWYFRPQVTLTYAINGVLSARYRYNLHDVNPSLSELSSAEQWIDSLQVRRDNPDLSPFLYHNDAMEFHVNTAKVKAGLTLSYQYQPYMVIEETLYDASRGLLIRTYDNQRSLHRFTPELYLNYSPFGDYLRMNISEGLNHFQSSRSSYSHTYTDPFCVIPLDSDVKNLDFDLLIYKRNHSPSGETSREADRFNRLGIDYRVGKVRLSASFSTQFTSFARYRSEDLSAIAPYVTDQRLDSVYPGFETGFSYHLDFGRKHKSIDHKLYSSNSKSDIPNSRK